MNGQAECAPASEISVDPPDGLLTWALGRKMLAKEYLIYRADRYVDPLTDLSEKCVRITCSACLRDAFAMQAPGGGGGCHYSQPPAPFGFYHPEINERIMSGDVTICPFCGAAVEAVHVGNMRPFIRQEAFVMTVGRLENKLLLRGWNLERRIGKVAETQFTIKPYEAYLVMEKQILKYVAYHKLFNSMSYTGVYEPRKRFSDTWGETDDVFPWDPRLLEGSTAENSKLDRYLKCSGARNYAIGYLRLWQKHPNIENLIMSGAGNLMASMIDRESHYSSPFSYPKLEEVAWKETRPAQMLHMNKDEFRACLMKKWDGEDFSFYLKARSAGLHLTAEELERCKKPGYDAVSRVLSHSPQHTLKAISYIWSQKEKLHDNAKGAKNIIDTRYLVDYWNMAEKIGEDLNDLRVRWPKNIITSHDRVMALQKQNEKAALKMAFMVRNDELSRFAWERDGIIIRPAASEKELIDEGRILNHCVASYAERHGKGETAMFFVRRAETPDKPWFTLELNEKTLEVRQNRGKCNCARTPEVQAFEAEWLKYIRNLGKKKEKKEVSAA